ncbi:uncharacterized protein LOC110976932 isoform X2 [Acanthaster planci]|nr:uncharacterized protein LOC110976932 isoform X2 [Acanthaster planci]XP_022086340.1 uncharacterized protein LOC110976932 isoform X2 [Acanthaster planci]XP_022086342.1 uncharacterized protein LOC110976932 isoform X2 [Acanthaster planci]
MDAISTCLVFVGLLGCLVGFSAGSDSALCTCKHQLKQIVTGPKHVWVVNTNNEIFSRQLNSATSHGEWVKQWSNKTAISVSPNGYIWALGSNYKHVYLREGITDNQPEGVSWKSVGSLEVDKFAVGKSGLWAVQIFWSGQRLYYRVGSYGDSGNHGTWWYEYTFSPKMKFTVKIIVGPNEVWFLDTLGQIFRLPVFGDRAIGSWQLYEQSHENPPSSQMIKGIAISPAGNMWAIWFIHKVSRKAGSMSEWIQDDDRLDLIDISAGKIGVWGTDGHHVYYRSGTYGDEYETTSLTGFWDLLKHP